MRRDEEQLWAAIQDGTFPRDAGAALDMPWKRVAYLCEKWAKQGKYEYGVSVDLGWVNHK